MKGYGIIKQNHFIFEINAFLLNFISGILKSGPLLHSSALTLIINTSEHADQSLQDH